MPATPRRRRSKEAARDDILAAATALFSEAPEADVTVDAICDRADMAKATFYLHFATKEAIAQDVVRWVTQPDMTPVDSGMEAGQPAVYILKELFLAQARRVDATPQLARMVYGYGINQAWGASPPLASGPPLPFVAVIERIVTYGQSRRMLRPDPDVPEFAAMAYCLFATTVCRWAALPAAGRPALTDRVYVSLVACLDGWFRSEAPVPVSPPLLGLPRLPLPDAVMRRLDS